MTNAKMAHIVLKPNCLWQLIAGHALAGAVNIVYDALVILLLIMNKEHLFRHGINNLVIKRYGVQMQ